MVNIPGTLPCDRIVGYLAVYRVGMAVASFFFVMMVIMFCVFSSKDPRAYIQNGYVGYSQLQLHLKIVYSVIVTIIIISGFSVSNSPWMELHRK